MVSEHPFAQYVRIIAKGPNLSRALTEAEICEAARMIMAGEVEPVQLGAFLCVLRVKTETSEEVAGFARGIRGSLASPSAAPPVDLDWPTYAGKSRQLPWYLLSVLLLAQSGVRVFMHGADAHTPNRLYARETLEALGIAPATSMTQAVEQLRARHFAYMGLEHLSPRLQDIMDLRSLLGVRSPIHTVARHLNPFDAPHQVLSVTHPPYRPVHRDAAKLLGQKHMVVFKGEGGEAERRPVKPCDSLTLDEGVCGERTWPSLLPESSEPSDADMDPRRLLAVWSGDSDDSYPVRSVTGTAAVALFMLGRASSPEAAQSLAEELWSNRNRGRILA
ncbi:MAG: glycosyl transferase family protein [Alphaproteobacteria bacterium]|nr:glycosyl transferase family protein [Alphaproteobacteria bacterium]MBF0128882.1 glycosyl transferase family protein [Alphaproteobacteria bacterium]